MPKLVKMEEQSKIIEQIGKKNPFKVPENYFDNFSAQLEQQIKQVEVAPAPAPAIKKSFFKAHIQPLLYVAAVVTLLTGISYVAVQPMLTDLNNEMMMANNMDIELSEDDYYDLLAEYDSDEIYELLSMND
ncbi:MAG: hypothetical protein II215_05090 [Paludibacteraceae bacterium]|jgi:hypothetical protein|nr:hypothetical protein [Paludibacteraceae bacterium]MED9996029.1 hypothetical protein [Paludibacteraceae bacterium]